MNCLGVFDHFVRLALKGLQFTNRVTRTTHSSNKKRVYSKQRKDHEKKNNVNAFLEMKNFKPTENNCKHSISFKE